MVAGIRLKKMEANREPPPRTCMIADGTRVIGFAVRLDSHGNGKGCSVSTISLCGAPQSVMKVKSGGDAYS